MYTQIINALCDSSKFLLPHVRTGSISRAIPGWNEYVKEAHSEARDAFLLWQCNSKPRSGSISDLRKTTRVRFRQCLRFCKSNEDRAKADALANNLLQKNNISFRKDVFKINRTDNNVQASTINGVTGDQNMTKLWHDHYFELLNSNNDTLYMSFVKSHMKTIDCATASPKFSVKS